VVPRKIYRVAVTLAAAVVAATVLQPTAALAGPASTSCTAALHTCWTGAIPANSDGHFVRYTLPPNCWGYVHDANNGNLVGPNGAWGTGRIWGLYGQYKMEVACVSFGTGMLSNTV
jgi:hypothetical protein